jgi:hypothetical protein
MLSKCANPECTATFRYLHQGKLYRARMPKNDPRRTSFDEGNSVRKPVKPLEFFWLCEGCAQHLTLAFDPQSGITVRPNASAKSAVA